MPATAGPHALKGIKALTFDVFGTVVNWRISVEDALSSGLSTKLASSDFQSLPPGLQQRAQALADTGDWAPAFAQQWRNAYSKFTQGFRAGETAWKDIDAHHHDSLIELLDKWELSGLYTPAEISELSLVWHRLQPWPDSSEGLGALNALELVTSTLSNGNTSLLTDLNEYGGLGFQRIISAEDFKAYKPDPKTYLGAAEKIGVQPGEVAMVAAHLGDLEQARKNGLHTIYVEREKEEAWGVEEDRYAAAKEWVDLWVGVDEGGFVEVAKRLAEVL